MIEGGALAQSNRSCCMLANTTSIVSIWSNLNRKFDLMHQKRAFIHWLVIIFEQKIRKIQIM